MILVPASSGSAVREGNDCHVAAGSRQGGQFCSKAGGPKKTGARSFKTKGVVDEEVVRQVFGRRLSLTSLQQVAAQMVEGVEADFAVTVSTRPGLDQFTGEAVQKVEFHFVSNESGPGNRTSMIRTLYRDNRDRLIVDHQCFEKHPSRPVGFGKGILRAHVKAYESLGVHRVDTYANIDVGAYAWARYGFLAHDPESFSRDVWRQVQAFHGATVVDPDTSQSVGLGDSQVRAIKSLLGRDPWVSWRVADSLIDGVKVGKQLMMQTDGWEAFLLLDRSEMGRRQQSRFWRYVGR